MIIRYVIDGDSLERWRLQGRENEAAEAVRRALANVSGVSGVEVAVERFAGASDGPWVVVHAGMDDDEVGAVAAAAEAAGVDALAQLATAGL
jgi:hypothetical protein